VLTHIVRGSEWSRQSGSLHVLRGLGAVLLLSVGACSKHRSENMRPHETAITRGEAPRPEGIAGAEADTAWLTANGVASLAKSFRALGLDVTDQGTMIAVAGKTVGLATRINNRVEKEGHSILAADFDILVDGIRVSTLTAGAIGVDDTPEHARATTAAEWASQYGAPIGFALATRFGATGSPSATDAVAPFYAKIEIDNRVLFYGPPGLRGKAKAPGEVSSDAFIRTLATSVVAVLREARSASEFRSATVLIVVQGKAVTGGECRIDGLVSAELFQALSKLSWPEGSPLYMFKLFFVGLSGGS
jgi:hypothetical protein